MASLEMEDVEPFELVFWSQCRHSVHLDGVVESLGSTADGTEEYCLPYRLETL